MLASSMNFSILLLTIYMMLFHFCYGKTTITGIIILQFVIGFKLNVNEKKKHHNNLIRIIKEVNHTTNLSLICVRWIMTNYFSLIN